MTSFRLVLASVLLLAVPALAGAGAGDPRLVNGVLEWPRVVTSEPFVIVRGDDGVLYYVAVGTARRHGALTAGARVSVLGTEGRTAHELSAFAVGSGPTTDAALAQLQGGRAAASAPEAAPAAPVASSTPATPVVAPPPVTPSAAAPAPVAAPPAPVGSPPAAVAAPVTPAPAAVPVAAPPAAVPSAPAGTSPAAVGTPHAPAPTPPAPVAAAPTSPVAAPAVVPASTASAAAARPPIVATAPMVPVDERRWTELTGEVESVSGRTLVLKVDGGRVTVDVSSVSANLERMVAPGSKVKVYGVPVELRFKAMGFIDPDARGRTR
jgi:hypothetical protein